MAALHCSNLTVALQHGIRIDAPIQGEKNSIMTEAWKTKYGPRRVRQDPPTLEEAIFAAKGLTDSLQAQAEIAAALMDMPLEVVTSEIMKSGRKTRSGQTYSIERSQRSVVVERRPIRRPVQDRQFASSSLRDDQPLR
jgi:hypothetical protein